MARWFVPFVAAAGAATSVVAAPADLPMKLKTRSDVKSRVANVHLEIAREVDGPVSFAYGSCSAKELRDTHHTVLEGEVKDGQRLVWIVPEDAESDGCISAFSDEGTLVGRSEPQMLHHHWKRRVKRDTAASIDMSEENGFDPVGPWMQSVKLLENKPPTPVEVEAAKAKEIAIVGAGMSGLMTWLVLHQAGMENVSLVEGSERLGGRVRTEYLSGSDFDYSYQEMGPMRFPHKYTDPETEEEFEISDQAVLYQLMGELNKLNGNSSEYKISLIEWLQSSPNALQYFDEFKMPETGLPPTQAQIGANSSLGPPSTPLSESAQALQAEVATYMPDANFTQLMAANLFQAHSDFISEGLNGLGGELFSETSFVLNYLQGSLNDTAAIGALNNAHSYFYTLVNILYFVYGSWQTVDGGLNRIPRAFGPLVKDAVTFGRTIERINYNENEDKKIELVWREDATSRQTDSASFDYTIISAPFSVVRGMRLPHLEGNIRRAIDDMPYDTACKIALEYSERFWEQYENPIYGSCSTTTDIPGIDSMCYPSYNLNGTGPASILASYTPGTAGLFWLSRSEEEHVRYVLDAMTEIHGEETRELYTGNYNRKCWTLDPLSAGGWASPTVGMHQLYIPEYHKVHKNMIFVGEHTSITQAWVASAVESGLRGAVQMLLELGLIDEANDAVDKWAARWIDI